MKKRRVVVLDTNCLIQSISRRSNYYPVWRSFINGEYYLCVSSEILEEYDEPEADEEEYVQELEALTFSCTEEELFALLARAEMAPVLPVYKAVLQYMNAN